MGVHETEGVAGPCISFNDVPEEIEKVVTVLVVPEYLLPGVPAGGDMVEGAGIFYTERAGHEETLSHDMHDCKT